MYWTIFGVFAGEFVTFLVHFLSKISRKISNFKEEKDTELGNSNTFYFYFLHSSFIFDRKFCKGSQKKINLIPLCWKHFLQWLQNSNSKFQKEKWNVFVYQDVIIDAKIPDLDLGIVSSGVNLIGGFVTRSIICNLICEQCKSVLKEQGPKFDWIKRREFPNCQLFKISTNLMKFFTCVEVNVKPLLSTKYILQKNFCQNIVMKVVTTYIMENDHMFSELRHSQGLEDHRYEILKKLCDLYVKLKVCRFLKEHNLRQRNKSIRRNYTKSLHFQNQW